jgi:hypothetical protein
MRALGWRGGQEGSLFSSLNPQWLCLSPARPAPLYLDQSELARQAFASAVEGRGESHVAPSSFFVPASVSEPRVLGIIP